MAKKEKEEKKGSRGCLIMLAIFLVLVFAIVATLYGVFHHYMGKTNYVEIDPSASIEINTEDIEEETVSGTNSPDDVIDQIIQDLEQNVNGGEESSSAEDGTENGTDETNQQTQAPTQAPVTNVAGVEHILLIGSDRRNQSWNGNSDSMIIITINKNTNKIVMTSLMRDTYVAIPGVGNSKLNHAYAKGGAALLLLTIRQNYGINITKYAIVDFSAFTSVINVLGTVPIALNDAEIAHLGGQLDGLHHEGNVYYLDGDAALAYSRIRYVGRYDYERTERQRKVLTQIFNQMKTMDLGQVNAMANSVLPYVTHNITNAEILSYVTQSANILKYQLVSNRVPYDGLYYGAIVNNQQVIALYWPETRAKLYSDLYQ